MKPNEYLVSILSPLLSRPEALEVKESHDDMGTLLSVNVHKDDMGSIIGKEGETAKAVRHLVRIVGIIAQKRVSIKINEPEGSTYKRKEDQHE